MKTFTIQLYDQNNHSFGDFQNILNNPVISRDQLGLLPTWLAEDFFLAFNNGQSRQLANIPWTTDITDNELFDLALLQLESIDLVGTQECLDRSIFSLNDLLGLPKFLPILKCNTSTTMFTIENLSSDSIFNFYSKNSVDLRLWSYVHKFLVPLSPRPSLVDQLLYKFLYNALRIQQFTKRMIFYK